MNLNKVFIIGRTTKQPEQRMTTSGMAITTFSIATNRVWFDAQKQKKEETEFINCTAFGKTAETIAKYVQKGQEVMIEGRMKTDAYQGKDGVKRYSTKIIVERFQFGVKAKGDGSDSGDGGYMTGASQKKAEIDNGEIPIIEEEPVMEP
jgi:single-strand DNA-binding protein